MNDVGISAEGIAEPTWLDRAEAFAQSALGRLGKDGWDLSILVCNDEFIRRLNAQYRDKDEPTDVLSFDQGTRYTTPEGEERWLAGDIVISLEALARNASRFGVPEDEELRRLIVHGILHLSGHDHSDNDPAQPMLKLQEELLAELATERIL